jgi:hypothetical protein
MTGAGVVRLTTAQLRCLSWLPADGSWSGKLGHMAKAVDSMVMYHSRFVEVASGPYGPKGGYLRRARLTEAGVLERRNRRSDGWPAT